MPLLKEDYIDIKKLGYKLCFVSPELLGQGGRLVDERKFEFDAVCTKVYNIEKWSLNSRN